MATKSTSKIHNYIVTDVETGGLSALKNPITDIALISLRGTDFSEISRYQSFIKPYNDLEYNQKALEVTGISMKDINGGQDFKKVVKDIIIEFEKAGEGTTRYKKPILVGHNIKFDINFYAKLFELAKEDLSKYIHGEKDIYGNFYPAHIDTIFLSSMKFGDREIQNLKLQTCVEENGLQLVDAHRAMNDTISTMELFALYGRQLRSTGATVGTKEVRFRDTFEF